MKNKPTLAVSLAILAVVIGVFAWRNAPKGEVDGGSLSLPPVAGDDRVDRPLVLRDVVNSVAPDGASRVAAKSDVKFHFIEEPGDEKVEAEGFSGSCVILILRDTRWRRVELPVEMGVSVLSTLDEGLGGFSRGLVMSANFDTRNSAVYFEPVEFSASADDVFVAVGRVGKRLIDVVDANTGERIHSVSTVIYNRKDWVPIHAIVPPMIGDVEVSSVPIEIDNPITGKTLWIGSPGYAWFPMDVHPSQLGVQVVELQQSSTLLLRCVGNLSATVFLDRVLPITGRGHVGAFVVEGGVDLPLGEVPAGNYRLFAVDAAGRRCLSEREVLVEAGTTHVVVITTDPVRLDRHVFIKGEGAAGLVGLPVSVCGGKTALIEYLESGVGFTLTNGAAYDSSRVSFMVSGMTAVLSATQSDSGSDFTCTLPQLVHVGIHNSLDDGRTLDSMQVTAMQAKGQELGDIVSCLGKSMVSLDLANLAALIEAPLGGDLFILGKVDGVFVSERVAIESEYQEIPFPSQVHSSVLISNREGEPHFSKGWLSGVQVETDEGVLGPFDIVVSPLGTSTLVSFFGALKAIYIPDLGTGGGNRWFSSEPSDGSGTRFSIALPDGDLETLHK